MNSSRSEPAKMRPAVTDFATGLEVWFLVDWLEPENKAIVRRRGGLVDQQKLEAS